MLRTATILISLVPLIAACATQETTSVSPAERAPVAPVYSGHYQFGFELAAFTSCNLRATWWVAPGELGVFKPLDDFITDHYADLHEGRFPLGRLFVRWRGTVTPLGRYGHRGAYPRQLSILEVLEVRWATPDDCADSPATKDHPAEPTAARHGGSSTVDLPRPATLLYCPATTRGDAE